MRTLSYKVLRNNPIGSLPSVFQMKDSGPWPFGEEKEKTRKVLALGFPPNERWGQKI
jgi:hypothetical protein